MKKIINLFILVCLSSQLMAQETVRDILATSNRSVEAAYRITSNPKLIDSIQPTPVLEYPLLLMQYPTSIKLDTIRPVTIKSVDKLNQLYHSYAKVGIGNYTMPLGEIYFANKRSRKYTYGISAKNISSFGKMKDYAPAQYDRTTGNLFGSIVEKNYTLKGDIHYGLKGFHYYNIKNDSLNRDSIAQRFQDLGGDFSFSSHKKDSGKVNYTVGLSYNNFFTKKPMIDSLAKWRSMENFFAVNGLATYKKGKEIFALELGVKYNGYKYGIKDTNAVNPLDTGLVNNNTIINLKPTITTFMKNNRFKALVGVDLTVDAHNKADFYVYPHAEFKYSLFNDLFIPFLGLRGGLKQQTLKGVTSMNEFAVPNLILKNENTPIDLFFGIKGTLSKRISFNVNASFSTVKNKLLFVSDTIYSLGNKFNVIYDNGNITKVEGSISYQLVEKLKIDAVGRFYSYELKNNAYAWNLPTYQGLIRANYNLYDKFIATLDFNLEGGRYAQVYHAGKDVKFENNQYAKSLGIITDFNIGIEYRYNTRISAFLQGNNMIAQRYYRWYNTPVQGIQVMGGITYRF